MYPEDGVLEAAQAIRPYLRGDACPLPYDDPAVSRSLLDTPEEAIELDAHIADELLRRSKGFTDRLRGLLRMHRRTAWFLAVVLADEPDFRPPAVQETGHHTGLRSGGFPGLLGDAGPVGADRYACPNGHYIWYRYGVGRPVPGCPTCGIGLLRR